MRDRPLILFVDDDPSGRDILQARLTAQHYDSISATDGETALAMVQDRKPDLILLDVMMPKINGIEVCRQIKSDADLPFIPVIMVTAMADSRDIVTGLDAGADEYLTKPYSKGDIILENGESVLLFTDGLVEAENKSGEQFTKSRLVSHLKACEGPPWGKSVLQRIEAWRGHHSANDDLTIMEVWRDPAPIVPDSDYDI
jgi:CheY-like chemotaxis protein